MATSATTTTEVNLKQWNLLFDCELKARYHLSRHDFLSLFERFVLIVSCIISLLLFKSEISNTFAIVIFIITLITSICLPSKTAGIHKKLSEDYIDLINNLESNQIDLNQANRIYSQLRKSESVFYRALEAQCYNDVCSVKNVNYIIKLDLFHKMFKHIFRFASLPTTNKAINNESQRSHQEE